MTAGKVGAATTRWVRDVGGNLLSQRSPDGSAAWYLSDGLGSTVAMVDGSGQVRTRYTYDPYGVTAVSCHGGGCVDNPWRFTGEYQDPTGMYKIGERYLSPELGRWTQADPASNRINPTSPGEPNPYAYAGCDPINNTDPSGLAVQTCTLVGIAVGGISTVVTFIVSGGTNTPAVPAIYAFIFTSVTAIVCDAGNAVQ